MGMDVIGRMPDDSSGEYFRASVWSWRALHELLSKLCGDLLSEELLEGMQFNSGAGPKDALVCKTMSAKFRKWLSTWEDDAYFLEQVPSVETPEAMVFGLFEQQLPGCQLVPLKPDYWVDREMLEEWTTFLDRCGGFAVW